MTLGIIATFTLCTNLLPRKSTASNAPRNRFIDFSDKRVRSSVRIFPLILNPSLQTIESTLFQ